MGLEELKANQLRLDKIYSNVQSLKSVSTDQTSDMGFGKFVMPRPLPVTTALGQQGGSVLQGSFWDE